ncbi:MAG TPA: UDP-N-acetylglucosamine 2-epimerase (non-hydrolyzing) [Candidatus Acidoferrales bacterium]|nr:UDP-N-acetylglucosamine 2-epimerase (non-hydrolyzing) [Candidatus Acidoferrales bacterium]
MKIAVFIGTRAELIGMAPFLKEIDSNDNTELIFTHTGQHYDPEMYEDLLEDLDLREPDFSLSCGNANYNKQIAGIVSGIDDILTKSKPDFVFVQGNVISSFSAAIASVMNYVPVGHIESGYRSLRDLHSDVRRKVIETCSKLFFPVCYSAYLNLLEECYDPECIYYMGDPLVDALLKYKKIAKKSNFIEKLDLDSAPIVTIAVRLPWNIGTPEALGKIVRAATELDEYNVIMLMHPNTKKHIIKFGLSDTLSSSGNIHLANPLPYTDFIKLMMASHVLVTDSGGPQKESALLETPCITLSDSTYYIETIKDGWNRLLGESPDPETLTNAIRSTKHGKIFADPLNDGKSTKRIIAKVVELYEAHSLQISPQVSKTSFYTHLAFFPDGFNGMRTQLGPQVNGKLVTMYDGKGDIVLDPHSARIVRTFGPVKDVNYR